MMMLDTGTTLLIILIAGLVMGLTKLSRILTEYRAFQAWRTAGGAAEFLPQHAEEHAHLLSSTPARMVHHQTRDMVIPSTDDLVQLDARTVPDAGDALLYPPADLHWTIGYIQAYYPHRYGRYTVPLGWHHNEDEAELVVGHLVDDINMTQLTAVTDGGKDNYILTWLFTLTAMYTPEHLQIVIIDGKGGKDYIGWERKAHLLKLAQEEDDIKPAMEFLTALRKRRNRFLRDVARKSKWDEYDGSQGHLPLVLVVISDLSLMEDAVKKSELYQWLALEVKGARSDGIRYLVCTQDTTGESSSWRNQMGLRICGFQPTAHADRPNTGLTPSEIEELGGVPPSKLPYPKKVPGVFTIVQGRDVVTVRTSHIDDAQRDYWLSRMPDTPQREHAADPMLTTLLAEATPTQEYAGVEAEADGVPSESFPTVAPIPRPAPHPLEAVQPLLDSLTHRELQDHPVFMAACLQLYQRHGTYRGVILALWDSYTGSREQTVKAALQKAEQEQDTPVSPRLASAA